MRVTAEDIRAADARAIASMTIAQRAAVSRMAETRQLGLIGEHSGKTLNERADIVAGKAADKINARLELSEDATTATKVNPLDVLFLPAAEAA